MNYCLMHKDDVACHLDMDMHTGNVMDMKIENPELIPIYVDSKRAMADWWSMRAIPMSIKRDSDRQFMRANDISTKEQFALKNLGLSLSDCYWIRPEKSETRFKDVNFYENPFDKIDLTSRASLTLAKGLTPLATTTGQMRKYWHIKNGKRILTKVSEKRLEGQLQCINEAFGHELHVRQQKYGAVPYSLEFNADKSVRSVSCPAFTSVDVEYVPMINMIEEKHVYFTRGTKLKNAIIDNCVKSGMEKSSVIDFFDYLAAMDFIMSNKDRHLNNFGLLRDSNTLEYIGFAPIFDSGNSMLYDNPYVAGSAEFKLLKTEIAGIYDTDKKLYSSFKKCRSLISYSNLPAPDFVCDFYRNSLSVSDDGICRNISLGYEIKLEILKREHPEIFADLQD